MNIGAFEMWETDKQLMESIIDRCIVAKLIESTSNFVPDDYSLCTEQAYGNWYPFFETVQDFLRISKIGKLEFRELEQGEYSYYISIQLYALEELSYFPLTTKESEIHDRSMQSLSHDMEAQDLATIEGECTVLGTRFILQMHYATGLAYEVCETLLTIHENAKKMILSIRRNQKGEVNNANTSQI